MVHEVSFRFPVIPFQKFFQETSITSWPCPTWFFNLRLLWLSSPYPPVLLLPEEGTFSFSQIQQTPRPPLHHSVFTPLSFAFCWFNVLLRYPLFLHPIRNYLFIFLLPFPLNFPLPRFLHLDFLNSRFLHLDFLNSRLFLAAVLISWVLKLSRPFQSQASHHLVAEEGGRVAHRSLKIGQVLNQYVSGTEVLNYLCKTCQESSSTVVKLDPISLFCSLGNNESESTFPDTKKLCLTKWLEAGKLVRQLKTHRGKSQDTALDVTVVNPLQAGLVVRASQAPFFNFAFYHLTFIKCCGSHFQDIPNSKHTIFYQKIFFLVRKYYHIWHTKHHCQQNKSAVAMLPCSVCSFEALSEKQDAHAKRAWYKCDNLWEV